MGFISKASLFATAYFILNANALPRPATYSVVNVDGGSAPAPTPTVIVQTTLVDDTPTTISVTVVQTASTTAIVTDHTTQWTHAEATETALIPEVSLHPHPEESHPAGPPHYMPVPVPTEDATVTVVSMVTPTPTTTTSYYDNGMWHTSYAIKHWSSDGAFHPGQWHPSSAAVSSAATGTAAPLVSRGIQASGYYAPSGYAAASGYAAPSAYLAKRDFAAPGRYAAAVMGDVQPFMGEKKN